MRQGLTAREGLLGVAIACGACWRPLFATRIRLIGPMRLIHFAGTSPSPPRFTQQMWKLRDDDLLHCKTDGGGGAGHGEENRATEEAADAAAEDRGGTDIVIGENAEDLAIARERLVEQAADRFVSLVAAGNAGSAGHQDRVHVVALAE